MLPDRMVHQILYAVPDGRSRELAGSNLPAVLTEIDASDLQDLESKSSLETTGDKKCNI